MKIIFGVTALTLLLAGCSPSVQPASFDLPKNCEIKELVAIDKSFEVFDQTATGVTDSRDCAIGVPNSDVGIFFGYSQRTASQWKAITKKLTSEGYEKWDAGYPGAEVWRMEVASDFDASCSLSGHIGGISFSATEPWVKCDDKWNKELVSHILNHAKVTAAS